MGATVAAAAETDAMHQAASAASLLGRRKPVGIQSPWPPSALFRAARMVHPCEEFVVRSLQLVSSHLGHQVRFLEQLAWCTLAKNSWSEVSSLTLAMPSRRHHARRVVFGSAQATAWW